MSKKAKKERPGVVKKPNISPGGTVKRPQAGA
jgi:hypothetical protein